MADGEQLPGGWLPPQAPGADPAPRFAPPALDRPPPPDRPAPPRPRPPAPAGGGTDPLAVASLVFGLAALALLVLTLGLGFFFVLLSAAAGWVCAVNARRRLATDPGRAGEGLANAGRIISLIALGLAVVAMVVWLVLIANGFSLEEFREDLQRELDRQRERRRDGAAQEASAGDGPLG